MNTKCMAQAPVSAQQAVKESDDKSRDDEPQKPAASPKPAPDHDYRAWLDELL
jgi:hypothetical protein